MAIARTAWLESEEGKRCLDKFSGQELKDRLVMAFVAGAKWAKPNLSEPLKTPPPLSRRDRAALGRLDKLARTVGKL
jgi:hypothetical protein